MQKFLLLDEMEPNTKPLVPSNDNTSISIKSVNASWTEKSIANTLHDINVTIPQKKLYAVVGPVGAGKVRESFEKRPLLYQQFDISITLILQGSILVHH